MALSQARLTKAEWEGIEVPSLPEEKRIFNLLIEGFDNVNIRKCSLPSLLSYTQIGLAEGTHAFLFNTFLLPRLKEISGISHLLGDLKQLDKQSSSLKKKDIIRIQNTARQLKHDNGCVIEFVLIDAISDMYSCVPNTPDWFIPLYAIYKIIGYNIKTLNTLLVQILNNIIDEVTNESTVEKCYDVATHFVLNNQYLNKIRVDTLYEHQKRLYSLVKRDAPSLIMYKAPTGTGKTLSPLGLLNKYRIVFICAARHVGLSLAKCAVSSKKRIAFAFNCESAGDIRLHYSAAKESIRDTRTGGIRKVDNSQGQNVELMISDLASAKYAIFYMKAFNSPSNLLVYWDEPTIALDVDSHPFHSYISDIWSNNSIPNIVLSSATLPDSSDIPNVISDYQSRFNGDIHNINGIDFERNVSVLNTDCQYVVPHTLWSNYEDFKRSIAHIRDNPSILRYISVEDCIKVVKLLIANNLLPDALSLSDTFENIGEVSIRSIKSHYLLAMANVKEAQFSYLDGMKSKLIRSYKKYSAHLTSTDAHTLTNAPTIYLANNVDKVGRFLLQDSKIPSAAMNDVYESITHNNKIMKEISKLEKAQMDSEKQASDDSKKSSRNMEMENQNARMIKQLRMHLKNAKLHDLFVPNTDTHLQQWSSDFDKSSTVNKPFTCNLNESDTAKVMSMKSTEDMWKLLLLMGIGVLDSAKDGEYMECMKSFASDQKLYLILASSDYIYGTNYQFAHAFIGKDMTNLTQDKAIQSIGRVGRTSSKKEYTVRLRNNNVAHLIFTKIDDQPESRNMNRLFITAT